MQEEDRRRVIDTEEVERKAEAVQGKSRSQGKGGGHCYVTMLFLFKSKCPGKDTLTH